MKKNIILFSIFISVLLIISAISCNKDEDEQPPSGPCSGISTFTYEGQVYNTVEIGTQCWMAENLNIGTMINGDSSQTNNLIIEKYCYDNILSNCDVYGGLYQWDEIMNYSIIEGTQGICPAGWHIPTDAEWCTLTQFIDPTVDCDSLGYSGIDVGTKMKSISGWNSGGNGTNNSGFNALSGGVRRGSFQALGTHTAFWSSYSTGSLACLGRVLTSSHNDVGRNSYYASDGHSVRCLKD